MKDAMEKTGEILNAAIDNVFNRSEKSENFKMPSFLERYAKDEKSNDNEIDMSSFLKRYFK